MFFFYRVSIECWLLFDVRSNPVLPQWHVKDPGHSAKSTDGRLHLNTHTPFTHRGRTVLTLPLSRQSVQIYQTTSSHSTRQETPSKSSHLTETLWTDPALISVRELISTLNERKTRRRTINCRTFHKSHRKRGNIQNTTLQEIIHEVTELANSCKSLHLAAQSFAALPGIQLTEITQQSWIAYNVDEDELCFGQNTPSRAEDTSAYVRTANLCMQLVLHCGMGQNYYAVWSV